MAHRSASPMVLGFVKRSLSSASAACKVLNCSCPVCCSTSCILGFIADERRLSDRHPLAPRPHSVRKQEAAGLLHHLRSVVAYCRRSTTSMLFRVSANEPISVLHRYLLH